MIALNAGFGGFGDPFSLVGPLDTMFEKGIDFGAGVSWPGYGRIQEYNTAVDAVLNAPDGTPPTAKQQALYDGYMRAKQAISAAMVAAFQGVATTDPFRNTDQAKRALVALLGQLGSATSSFLTSLSQAVAEAQAAKLAAAEAAAQAQAQARAAAAAAARAAQAQGGQALPSAPSGKISTPLLLGGAAVLGLGAVLLLGGRR